MLKIIRRFIKMVHPEGIPWPMSLFYDRLSRSSIFLRHYDLAAEDICRYFSGGRLLDVGTGPGRLLFSIRKMSEGAELHGADISAAMVKQAALNAGQHGISGITFHHADAAGLPFADEYFDCVVSTGSIHHWNDISQGLAEIHRVLKKGGYALIYDLVQVLPADVRSRLKNEYGTFRMALLWLHSFEEPFYSVEEMRDLADGSSFTGTDIHFTGGLCCLVMKKPE